MIIVKKGYRFLNEKKLVGFATSLKVNLKSALATFPTPPFTEAEMGAAIKAYQKAAGNWRSEKSGFNMGQTRNKRKDLIELLDGQVAYAEETAPDDAALIALGLAPIATRPSKAPLPGKPMKEGAKESGMPQSAIVFCKPVKLENSSALITYCVFETNEAGTEEYALVAFGTNSRGLTVSGLTTGKVYYFYIRAKTSTGFGPPSNVIRWVGR